MKFGEKMAIYDEETSLEEAIEMSRPQFHNFYSQNNEMRNVILVVAVGISIMLSLSGILIVGPLLFLLVLLLLRVPFLTKR